MSKDLCLVVAEIIWLICFSCGFSTQEDSHRLTKQDVLCKTQNDSGLLECNRRSCDIAFLLDGSASIPPKEFRVQKTFASLIANVTGLSKQGPHYAVIQFSQHAKIEIAFNEFHSWESWKDSLMSLKQEGSTTRIDLALRLAFRRLFTKGGGARPYANRKVFLLTDGSQTETNDYIKPEYEAMSLRYMGASVFVIGVGSAVDKSSLNAIAGSPDNVIYAKNFLELLHGSLIRKLEAICSPKPLKVPFHLTIELVSLAKGNSNVTIRTDGSKETVVVKPGTQSTVQWETWSLEHPPPAMLTAVTFNGTLLLINGSRSLQILYRRCRQPTRLLIEEDGITVPVFHQICLTVFNQLANDVTVRWTIRGQAYYLAVGPNQESFNHSITLFSLSTPARLVFSATTDNGDVSLNGRDSYAVDLREENEGLNHVLLYTALEKDSLANYTCSYEIFNIGDHEVTIHQGENAFQMGPYTRQLKKISVQSRKQPDLVRLGVTLRTGSRNQLLTFLLPVDGGNHQTIYVGGDSDPRITWRYLSLVFFNPLRLNSTYVSVDVVWQKTALQLPYGQSRHKVLFAYFDQPPAMDLTPQSLNSRAPMFINDKKVHLVAPVSSHATHELLLQKEPGRKYFLKIHAVNRLPGPARLFWRLPENIRYWQPIQSLHETYLEGNSDKLIKFFFHSVSGPSEAVYFAKPVTNSMVAVVNMSSEFKLMPWTNGSRLATLVITPGIDVSYVLPRMDNSKLRSAAKSSMDIQRRPVHDDSVTGHGGTMTDVSSSSKVKPYQRKQAGVGSRDKPSDMTRSALNVDQKHKRGGNGMSKTLPGSVSILHDASTSLAMSLFNLTVKVVNSWDRQVTLKWSNDKSVSQRTDSHALEGTVDVKPGQERNVSISVDPTKHPRHVLFQVTESKTGLLVVFPRQVDTFRVKPANYTQHFIFHLLDSGNLAVFQCYYISLKLVNLATEDAVLTWTTVNGRPLDRTVVPGGGSDMSLDLLFTHDAVPGSVNISASTVSGESSLSLNGGPVLSVMPILEHVPIPVFIADASDAGDLPKSYFVDLDVWNEWDRPVTLVWLEDLTFRHFDVIGKERRSKLIVLTSETKPEAMLFKLKAKDNVLRTGNVADLNIQPSEAMQKVVLKIDSEGRVFNLSEFYLDLLLDNSEENAVLVRHTGASMDDSQSTGNEVFVPGKRRLYVRLPFVTDVRRLFNVTLSAEPVGSSEEAPLTLNGEPSLSMSPKPSYNLQTIKISRDDNTAKMTPRVHFLDVGFTNNISERVYVKWDDSNATMQLALEAGQTKRYRKVYTDTSMPRPVDFYIYSSLGAERFRVNDRGKISVVPSQDDKEVNFVLDQAASSAVSYLHLNMANNFLEDVDVNVVCGSMRRSWVVPSRTVKASLVEFSFDGAVQEAVVTANTQGKDDQKVKINDADAVYLLPSISKEHVNLYIGFEGLPLEKGPLRPYSVHLNFTNDRDDDVLIKWTEGSYPKDLVVPGRSSRIYRAVLVNSSMAPIFFSVFDKSSARILLLNGRDSFKVEPTDEDVKVFQVVIRQQGRGALYVSQLHVEVRNDGYQAAVLSWTVNGETRTFDVPARFAGRVVLAIPVLLGGEKVNFAASAVNSSSALTLNGVTRLEAALQRQVQHLDLIVNGSGHPYTACFSIHNSLATPIDVSWVVENGTRRLLSLGPETTESFDLASMGYRRPDTILLSAVRKADDAVVYLNGETFKAVDYRAGRQNWKRVHVTATPDKADSSGRLVVFVVNNTRSRPVTFEWTVHGGVYKSNFTAHESKQLLMVCRDGRNFGFVFRAYCVETGNELSVSNEMNAQRDWGEVAGYSALEISEPDSNPRLYSYEVDIKNVRNGTVKLAWHDGGIERVAQLPGGDRVRIADTISTKQPPDVVRLTVTCHHAGKVATRPFSMLQVRPSLERRLVFVALKCEDVNAVEVVEYSLTVCVANDRDDEVTLAWRWYGDSYVTTVPGSASVTLHLVAYDVVPPSEITFVASTASSRAAVKLNGVDALRLSPSLVKKPVFVYVDREGLPTVVLPIELRIYNRHGSAARLSWTLNGLRRELQLLPAASEVVSDTLRVPNASMESLVCAFTAYDANTNEELDVNGSHRFEIRPSFGSLVLQSLVVQEHAVLLKLLVYNLIKEDVTIVFRQGSLRTKAFVIEIPFKEVVITACSGDEPGTLTAYRRRGDNAESPVAINETVSYVLTVEDMVRSSVQPLRFFIAENAEGAALKYRIFVTNRSPFAVRLRLRFYDSTSGHATSTSGHATSTSGRAISTSGHATSTSGHATSTSGHATSTSGHATSTSGDQTFSGRSESLVPADSVNHLVEMDASKVPPNASAQLQAFDAESDRPLKINDRDFVPVAGNLVEPLEVLVSNDISQPPVTYQLDVTNENDFAVILVSDDDAITHSVEPLASHDILRGTFPSGSDVLFRAYRSDDRSVRLIVNSGLDFVAKHPASPSDPSVTTVIISTNESRSFLASFQSFHAKDAYIIWAEGAEKRFVTVKPHEKPVYREILGVNNHERVLFRAFEVESGKQLFFTGRSIDMYAAFSQGGPSNVSITVVGPVTPEYYFYRLRVYNFHKNDIVIRLRNNFTDREALVSNLDHDRLITTPLKDQQQVSVAEAFAFDATSRTPLYINNRPSLFVKPSLDDNHVVVANITGLEIPLGLYYYELLVSTPADTDVLLKCRLDYDDHVVRIPRRSTKYRMTLPYKSFRVAKPVAFQAFDEITGRRLLIDGSDSVVVRPDEEKALPKFVTVSDHDPSLRATFVNENPFDAAVVWRVYGTPFRHLVPAKASHGVVLVSQADERAKAEVEISAVKASDNTSLLLNGSKSLVVSSTPGKDAMPVVFIESMPNKSCSFSVRNLLERTAALRWGMPRRPLHPIIDLNETSIAASSSLTVRVAFDGDTEGDEVELTSTESILLNNATFISCIPSAGTTFVDITLSEVAVADEGTVRSTLAPGFSTTSESKKGSFYYILVTNNLDGDCVLKWRVAGAENEETIPVGSKNKTVPVALPGVLETALLTVTAKKKDSNEVARVNGERELVAVLPTNGSNLIVVSVGAVERLEYYFYSLQVLSKVSSEVLVQYKIGGRTLTFSVGALATERIPLQFPIGEPRELVLTAETKSGRQPLYVNNETMMFIGNVNSTLKVVVTDAVVKRYHLVLTVNNTLDEPVVLQWSPYPDLKQAQVVTSKSVEDVVVSLTATTLPSSIVFVASDLQSGKALAINNSNFVSVLPTDTSARAFVVVHLPDVVLSVRNPLTADVRLIIRARGDLFTALVAANMTTNVTVPASTGLTQTTVTGTTVDLATPVDLNGNETFVVQSGLSDSNVVPVVVSERSGVYYTITLRNLLNESVVVTWEANNRNRYSLSVAPLAEDINVTVDLVSLPAVFVAVAGDEVVLINSSESLVVNRSLSESDVLFVVLHRGESQLTHAAVAVTVPLDSYYCTLFIRNKLEDEVIIEWDDSFKKRQHVVPGNVKSYVLLITVLASTPPGPVSIRARHAASNLGVQVNGTDVVYVDLARDASMDRYLVLGKDATVTLLIKNHLTEDVKVSWMKDGIEEWLVVSARTQTNVTLVAPRRRNQTRFVAEIVGSAAVVNLNEAKELDIAVLSETGVSEVNLSQFLDTTASPTPSTSPYVETPDISQQVFEESTSQLDVFENIPSQSIEDAGVSASPPVTGLYYAMSVENRRVEDILIFWEINGVRHEKRIRGKSEESMLLFSTSDMWQTEPLLVRCSSLSGEAIALNSSDYVLVNPTKSRYPMTHAIVDPRRVGLFVSNPLLEDAVVTWKEGDRRQQRVVPRDSDLKIVIPLPGHANDGVVEAYTLGTGKKLLINGADDFYIGSIPASESDVTVALDVPMSEYVCLLSIDNRLSSDLKLSWHADGEPYSYEVPARATSRPLKIVVRSRAGPVSVQISGVVVTTGQRVNVDGSEVFTCEATAEPGTERRVVLDVDRVEIVARNLLSEGATVTWRFGEAEDQAFVPPSSADVSFSVPASNENGTTTLLAHGTNSTARLALNSAEFFEVPQAARNESVVRITISRQEDRQVASLLDIESQLEHDSLVSWTEAEVPRNITVPAGSKLVARIREDSAAAQSEEVAVSGVDTVTGDRILLNGREELRIGNSKRIRVILQSTPKFRLNLTNLLGEQVRLVWSDPSTLNRSQIGGYLGVAALAKSVVVEIPANRSGDRLRVSAVSTDDPNFQVLINSADSLVVVASGDKSNVADALLSASSFYAVNVSNPLGRVNLKWRYPNSSTLEEISIRPYAVNQVIKIPVKADAPLVLSAFTDVTGFDVLVNGMKSFTLNPVLDIYSAPLLVLSKSFMYVLDVRNPLSHDALVLYAIGGVERQVPVRAGTSRRIVVENGDCSESCELEFWAASADGTSSLYINNNKSIRVPGALSEADAVMGDLSALRFINLNVDNQVGRVVKLEWPVGRLTESVHVPSDSNGSLVSIPLFVTSSESERVVFKGTTLAGDQVMLNGKSDMSLSAMPNAKAEPVNVILTKGDQKMYKVRLNVVNKYDSDVVLEHRVLGVTEFKETAIAGNQRKIVDLFFPPQEGGRQGVVRITAYASKLFEKLRVNKRNVMFVYPSLEWRTENVVIDKVVPGEEAQYNFAFTIVNDGGSDVKVTWKEGEVNKTLLAPATSQVDYETVLNLTANTLPSLLLKAYKAGSRQRVLLDGKYVVSVAGTKSVGTSTVIHVNANGRLSDKEEYYHLGVDVDNRSQRDVALRWQENGLAKELLVEKFATKSYDQVFRSSRKPDVVTMVAVDVENNNKSVELNERMSVVLQPSRFNRRHTVVILPDDTSAKLNTYFFGLDVENLSDRDVNVRWSEPRGQQNILIKAKTQESYDTGFVSAKQPDDIKVSAVQADSEIPVLLNGQPEVNVTPSDDRTRVYLVIGDHGSRMEDYRISLQVNNLGNNQTVIRWQENGARKKWLVSRRSTGYRDITLRQDFEPPPIEFRAFRGDSSEPELINGLDSVSVQPTKTGTKFATFHVLPHEAYETVPDGGARLRRCKQPVDIAFMLDRSGTMKRAWHREKDFTKRLAEHFTVSPDHARVGLVTFGEDAEIHVEFNERRTLESFQKTVDALPFEGYRTRMHRGFEEAVRLFSSQSGARDGTSKLLFVITDGRQSPHANTQKLMASYAASLSLLLNKVKIIAIGMHGTSKADIDMLQFLTKSRKDVYIVDDPRDLTARTFLDGLVYNYCQVISERHDHGSVHGP